MAITTIRRLHIGDIDAAGIAYTPRIIGIAIEAYEEALASTGLDFAGMLRGGRWGAPLVHQDADFRRPLRHGERVHCAVSCERIGDSSFTCRVDLVAEGTEVPAAVVRFTAVCIDQASFRPETVPPELRAAIERLGPPPV